MLETSFVLVGLSNACLFAFVRPQVCGVAGGPPEALLDSVSWLAVLKREPERVTGARAAAARDPHPAFAAFSPQWGGAQGGGWNWSAAQAEWDVLRLEGGRWRRLLGRWGGRHAGR